MNKLIGTTLGIAISIIVLASILMPVMTEYTDATRTVTNTGSFFAEPDGEEHTLVFSVDGATVDDVAVAYPEGYGTGNQTNATVILGEDWMVRLDMGLARVVTAGPSQTYTNLGYVADGDITFTISGTTLSYTYNNTTITKDNVTYYLAPAGDMVLCYNPYILSDSQLIGGIRNNSNTANADVFEIVSGTVDDGFTAVNCRAFITAASPTTGDYTSTFTTATETVDGDLLKLTSITQNLTFWNDGTATFTLTYLMAPATITYDNPDYLGTENASLLKVIPILMIIAMVMLAVGMVVARRD